MPDLPLYGTEPRVRCRNLRGPWQEIELRVHGYDEIDRPEFWKFVDRGGGRLRQVLRAGAADMPTSCSPGSNSAASGTSPAAVSRSAARSSGTPKCWKN